MHADTHSYNSRKGLGLLVAAFSAAVLTLSPISPEPPGALPPTSVPKSKSEPVNNDPCTGKFDLIAGKVLPPGKKLENYEVVGEHMGQRAMCHFLLKDKEGKVYPYRWPLGVVPLVPTH